MTNRRLLPCPPIGPSMRGRPSLTDNSQGWELTICGDLTDKELEITERLAAVPARTRGTIFFDSCGGSAYSGLGMATMIRLRGLDPLAVVAGECSSVSPDPLAE